MSDDDRLTPTGREPGMNKGALAPAPASVMSEDRPSLEDTMSEAVRPTPTGRELGMNIDADDATRGGALAPTGNPN